MHWFNPLVWHAYRRSLTEREVACDDAALRAGADAADYAGHLLALARTLRPPHPALAAMAARPALETRILSILTPDRRRGPASRASTLATAGVALALAVAVAALDPVAREAPVPSGPARVASETPAPVALASLATTAEPKTSRPAEPAGAPAGAPAGDPPGASATETPAVPDADPAEARAALRLAAPARPQANDIVPPRPTPTPAPVALRAPLAFKAIDPDAIMRQVVQLRATVAALHDLDPEALSTEALDDALAAVPDLTDEARAALHAEALADLSSATAAAERRLSEAETAFERDVRGGRGARGPSI